MKKIEKNLWQRPIQPFPGNGGMSFICIIFDFLPSEMDLLGGYKVFYFNPVQVK